MFWRKENSGSLWVGWLADQTHRRLQFSRRLSTRRLFQYIQNPWMVLKRPAEGRACLGFDRLYCWRADRGEIIFSFFSRSGFLNHGIQKQSGQRVEKKEEKKGLAMPSPPAYSFTDPEHLSTLSRHMGFPVYKLSPCCEDTRSPGFALCLNFERSYCWQATSMGKSGALIFQIF